MSGPGMLVLSLTVAVLSFFYFALTVMVVRCRRKFKLPYLVNEDKQLVVKVRAHANFIEYVPLALIIMLMSVMLAVPVFILSLASIMLICGRVLHAYSLLKLEHKHIYTCRVAGMVLTFVMILLLSIFNAFLSVVYLITG